MSVTVYLTRHAQSTANFNLSKSNPESEKLEKFTNSGLSPLGIIDVVKNRTEHLSNVGKVDYIFSSPLKRAIETCLLTHIDSLDQPVYVMALVTEFADNPDCTGDYIESIKSDVDITSFPNCEKLDFEIYFWKNNPHRESGKWWELSFRYDLHGRVGKLIEFLKNPEFTGKTVSIFAHCGVVSALLGFGIQNYKTVKFEMCQKTGTINVLEIYK
jgi:broad specificity phosphatase PhoE